MASTIPAMRGKLGNTEYFIVTMKAKEVGEKMKAAVAVEGWEDLSLEQKYQRNIDLKRVRMDIAPYLAGDPNRFFGALIVAVQNGEKMRYEPVKEVISRERAFTGSHYNAADGLGFLTLEGEEILIPIDGQHRAKALDFAIRGRDEQNKELDFHANPSLAQEDVTLMLIRFDSDAEKALARKIFNKVNRYAKRPSKGENLVIDDDDVAAVFARRMTEPEEELFSGDLVTTTGNTLSDGAAEFTTLATLYEINREILIAKNHDYRKTVRPDKQIEKIYWSDIEGVWKRLVADITHFSNALKDRGKDGNEVRRQIRRVYLLGKPVGQRVLASAFLQMTEKKGEFKDIAASEPPLSPAEACERLNAINWRIDDAIWLNVLTRDSTRVLNGVSVMKLGRDFVTYLAGRQLTEQEEGALRQRISPDDEDYALPERVCPVIDGWIS